MGKIEQGVNGGFRGKIGNTVGYKWRDIWVMRSLPKPSNKPRSPKQLANQAKFALMQELLQLTIDFIRVGFSLTPETKRMSEFNAAMSYNKKHAIRGEFPELEIDFSKFMFAQGELEFPENLRFNQKDGTLEITWDTLKQYNSKAEDQLMWMIIDAEQALVYGSVFGEPRRSGAQRMDLEGVALNKEYHCFAAFVSGDRKQVSNSNYFGTIFLEGKRIDIDEDARLTVLPEMI